MAAGDPGTPKRNFSSTAVETSLQSSIPAQSQGQSNTSFIVASVSGFPSVPFTLIVDPDTSKEEVVTATAASSTTLTVTRGEDSTQAVAHSAGAVVRHGVSGRDFREEQTHIAARGYDEDQAILDLAYQTHVHGIVTGEGVVVGTLKTQTLTNKTLTSPIINGGQVGDNGITFEGSTADAHETFLAVTDPTADRTITLPDATGNVVLDTLAQTLTNKTLTSPTISGSPVITGLSSAGMVSSSATPKDYVDAILGSATAAATSAASAAASATAAATSATSAATSATSAATSATSAAASATAAATSAASAATSATSAAAAVAASFDAKGDLLVGTGAQTFDQLTVAATAGYVLAVNSSTTTGLEWQAPNTGDITGVTAGTGLSGGGTSGTVTLNLDTTSVYVVPSQATHSGKFLTTDGSTSSWAAVDALPSQTGNSGKYLTTDGSSASWAVITTDPTPTVFMLGGM